MAHPFEKQEKDIRQKHPEAQSFIHYVSQEEKLTEDILLRRSTDELDNLDVINGAGTFVDNVVVNKRK